MPYVSAYPPHTVNYSHHCHVVAKSIGLPHINTEVTAHSRGE
jgi:hypothetical protein